MWWQAESSSTEKPRSKSQMYCPLQRKKQCKVCHTCAFWIPIKVKEQPTGDVNLHWNCAHVMGVLVQQDVGQAAMETGAAVESFRNEVVRLMAAAMSLFSSSPAQRAEALTYAVSCRGPHGCDDPHAPSISVPIAECRCHREKAAQLAGSIVSGMEIREKVHESIRIAR